MNDLNMYLMNKDHDFVAGSGVIGGGGVAPMIGRPPVMHHQIGMNPPPVTTAQQP